MEDRVGRCLPQRAGKSLRHRPGSAGSVHGQGPHEGQRHPGLCVTPFLGGSQELQPLSSHTHIQK